MRIIDLLNLIAKGEEVPKKIKYLDNEFEYDDINNFYYDKGYSMYRLMFGEGNCLNDEVIVIEEEKEIEKIKELPIKLFHNKQKILANKLNELIDVINDMRDKE